MQILLLVTGDLEKKALARSIERVWHQAGSRITVHSRLVTSAAMTSYRLPDPSDARNQTPTPVTRMATALVTDTLVKRSRGEPLPDLVIGVDDLELGNLDTPSFVLGWVRRAVGEVLGQYYPSLQAANRARAALRERCSFHLAAPLIEAYFFGEHAALQRAGVTASVPVQWSGGDVEGFVANGKDFAPTVEEQNSLKRGRGMPWWDEAKHAKRYLEFLVEQSGGLYDEVAGGVAALETLDWPHATTGGAEYARALFQDIADRLGVSSALGSGTASPLTYPGKTAQRDALMLRNA